MVKRKMVAENDIYGGPVDTSGFHMTLNSNGFIC
jgi:hypothetical protein